ATAELLEVVRPRHAAGVEEVLVLPDAPRPRRRTLALGSDAIDRHFRLIDRDGAGLADLGTHLIHQIQIRVKAKVAQPPDHPIRARRAELRRPFSALLPVGPLPRVGPLAP